jgi:ketosteroid isomerase-like protein
MMRHIVWVMAVLLLALPAAAQNPEEVLMQTDRDFAKAFAENHVEGWMQYTADDGVMLHSPPVVGKEAVRKFAQEVFGDPKMKLEWEPTYGELFKSGTMGVTTGRWKSTNPEGKTNTGNYVTVWQKQKDGSWKFVADGGTPDPKE